MILSPTALIVYFTIFSRLWDPLNAYFGTKPPHNAGMKTEEPTIKVTEETPTLKPTEPVSTTTEFNDMSSNQTWHFLVLIWCQGEELPSYCWGSVIHERLIVTSSTCFKLGGICDKIEVYAPKKEEIQPIFLFEEQFIWSGYKLYDIAEGCDRFLYFPFQDIGILLVRPQVADPLSYVDFAIMPDMGPPIGGTCDLLELNYQDYGAFTRSYIMADMFETCDSFTEEFNTCVVPVHPEAAGLPICLSELYQKLPGLHAFVGQPMLCDGKLYAIQAGENFNGYLFWTNLYFLLPDLKVMWATLVDFPNEHEEEHEEENQHEEDVPIESTLSAVIEHEEEKDVPIESALSAVIEPSLLFGFRIYSQGAENSPFKFLVVLTIFVKFLFYLFVVNDY